MNRIAAIVVSLPERHHMLKECLDAIAWQTREPDDVVVGIDPRHYGEVGNCNRLIDATDCEWLAFCHDDDLWDRNHLEVAESFFDQGDIIVARFRMEGRPESTMERWHDNFEDLRFTNWIASPSMIVARKEVFGRFVGPFGPFRWVDWAQWNHLLEAGARFIDTRQVTTTARYGHGNGSWAG